MWVRKFYKFKERVRCCGQNLQEKGVVYQNLGDSLEQVGHPLEVLNLLEDLGVFQPLVVVDELGLGEGVFVSVLNKGEVGEVETEERNAGGLGDLDDLAVVPKISPVAHDLLNFLQEELLSLAQ